MPQISKAQIKDAIFAIERGIGDDDCDAAVFMLQGLLDQPEGEPITADDITDEMVAAYHTTTSSSKEAILRIINAYLGTP